MFLVLILNVILNKQKPKTIKSNINMKKIKKSAIAIAVLVLVGASFQSCKKVSNGKLDGEWAMSSGQVIETSPKNDNTIETKTYTYDGVKVTEVKTPTPAGYVAPAARLYSMTLAFDKEKGTYTQIIKSASDENEKQVNTVKKDQSGNLIEPLKLTETIVTEYTFTKTGVFSITGGSGDIKKNSQILLREGGMNTLIESTYTYKDGSNIVAASGRYYTNSGEPLKTTETYTTNTTGESYQGVVYTVDELAGGVMKISAQESKTVVNDGTTKTYSSSISWSLNKK
jgi:hypothetical protein